MTPTTTLYGGYAITALKEAGGEETPRFEAYITKDGDRIIHVSNDGHGSSHRYQPVTTTSRRSVLRTSISRSSRPRGTGARSLQASRRETRSCTA